MDDEKHLSFISRNAAQELTEKLKNCKVPILFGHHPLSFFSEKARDAFNAFSNQNTALIYLCGHMHKPEGMIYPFSSSNWGIAKGVHEITIGGIFANTSESHQASFAIEEIQASSQPHLVQFMASIFTYSQNPFGFFEWKNSRKCDNIRIHRVEDQSPQDTDEPRNKERDKIILGNEQKNNNDINIVNIYETIDTHKETEINDYEETIKLDDVRAKIKKTISLQREANQ